MVSSEPGPLAAGPAIVRAIGLAADLARLTARTSGRADLVQRTQALAAEIEPLAAEDAAAYSEFLRTRSDEARTRTIELPLRMAELAADVAEVAADAVTAARTPVSGDAQVGVLLAEAGAQAAALLVRTNSGQDLAGLCVRQAAAARFRALL